MRGLPFRIGSNLYALQLTDIHEVLPLAALRQVPGSAPSVAGLLNLHGRAVPVIDLAMHCIGRSEPVDVRTRLVLLAGPTPVPETSAEPIGLALSTTGDIVDAAAGTVQPCPVSTAGLPFLAGMSPWREGTVQWISAPALRATLSLILRQRESHDV